MTGVKATKKRKSRYGAYEEEAGDTAEAVGIRNASQNDAFRARMLRAIALGEEQAKEGVIQADPMDARSARAVSRGPTFVATASSLSHV